MKQNSPKTLLFDIENAPSLAYIWQLKNDYINPRMLKSEWYMLCWSAKWLGEKEIMSAAICQDANYNPNKPSDKEILVKLRELLDEADIVVAHNGKMFDVKKANTRFIGNRIPPPSPFRVIDTLAEARRHFLFTANSLNELGKFLGVGTKIRTGGFDLWEDCMNGDMNAWKRMIHYCENDVRLLERVYLKMRPFIKNHPNISVIRGEAVCPKCGSKRIVKRGYMYTQSGTRQRFQCLKCFGWGHYVMGTTRSS